MSSRIIAYTSSALVRDNKQVPDSKSLPKLRCILSIAYEQRPRVGITTDYCLKKNTWDISLTKEGFMPMPMQVSTYFIVMLISINK